MSRCYRHIAPLERVGAANAYGFNAYGFRCATIPHCAPLERGDWMCRAAIDISLLWSERHQHTKIQGAASIVGARFPRPGWGIQPLGVGLLWSAGIGGVVPTPTSSMGVQGCVTIPHCAPLERGDWMCRAAIDISLLWSERHQHTKIQGAASIVGARFPRPSGLGNPTPTNLILPILEC